MAPRASPAKTVFHQVPGNALVPVAGVDGERAEQQGGRPGGHQYGPEPQGPDQAISVVGSEAEGGIGRDTVV